MGCDGLSVEKVPGWVSRDKKSTQLRAVSAQAAWEVHVLGYKGILLSNGKTSVELGRDLTKWASNDFRT